jgi:hypothetical protein
MIRAVDRCGILSGARRVFMAPGTPLTTTHADRSRARNG